MEKPKYITEEERRKCQKVVDAYKELYEQEDIIVLDTGRYGFVKLQCYSEQYGFDSMAIFTDSEKLFYDLWEDWVHRKLFALVKGTPMVEMEYEEIFQYLPVKMRKEFIKKRIYFEQKARDNSNRKKGFWKVLKNKIEKK